MKKILLLLTTVTLILSGMEYDVRLYQRWFTLSPTSTGYDFSDYELSAGVGFDVADRVSTHTQLGISKDIVNAHKLSYTYIEQSITYDLLPFSNAFFSDSGQPQISIGVSVHLAPIEQALNNNLDYVIKTYDFGYALIIEQGVYFDIVSDLVRLYGGVRYQFANYNSTVETITRHSYGIVLKGSYLVP